MIFVFYVQIIIFYKVESVFYLLYIKLIIVIYMRLIIIKVIFNVNNVMIILYHMILKMNLYVVMYEYRV